MDSLGPIGNLKSNDILMDVIRAADPTRERLAIERLQGVRDSDAFKAILNEPASRGFRTASTIDAHPTHSLQSRMSVGASFEAAILSSLIESMFSMKSDSAFGSGVAGSSFKSLFASQVAEQVARSGSLGIAEIIERHKNLRVAAEKVS